VTKYSSTIKRHTLGKTQTLVYTSIMWWLGDGSHRGKVAKPERRWGCRRGTHRLRHSNVVYRESETIIVLFFLCVFQRSVLFRPAHMEAWSSHDPVTSSSRDSWRHRSTPTSRRGWAIVCDPSNISNWDNRPHLLTAVTDARLGINRPLNYNKIQYKQPTDGELRIFRGIAFQICGPA